MMLRLILTGSSHAPGNRVAYGIARVAATTASVVALVLLLPTHALAQTTRLTAPPTSSAMTTALDEVRQQALRGVTLPGPATPRIEVEFGQLDARLKLAPCQHIEPHLPAGQRLWGSGRIGLRCRSGAVPWNVYLPVTVRAWAPAVVVSTDLPADTELGPEHLRLAEVDLAAAASPAQTDPGQLLGRRLAVALKTGTAIRAQHLRARQWFAAGDQVTVVASGAGFAVSATAQALAPGREGQPVRLRTESGRILSGMPVGMHRVEIRL